ncbi:MAG: Rne/Rng family ribonuclease [Pseudomonadota bacterium]
MSKKMLIDATHAEETRVVVVDGNKVEEFDFESQNKRQLAGNIYLAKVTRVEPSLQAAFVDYGGNRHGFLAFSEIHPDYYQIPVADREALLAEERAYAEAMRVEDEEQAEKPTKSRRRSSARAKAESVGQTNEVVTSEATGMETIEVDEAEAASPMELVPETPVETPAAGEEEANYADVETSDEAMDDDRPSIEAIAHGDDTDEVRPARKPRPRRYKIQEVIKVRQILLIQVVKEERGNKGAALTTYLSLAGRYCVLMPNTARGGGISRKITNAADRKKLKEIAGSIEVPEGAGLIVRTAGAKRTKTEIKRDYEYLQRMWEQVRSTTLESIAPSKIYEEGDLIKRSIRDLYGKEIDEVLVEGDSGYRNAKDFMKMIMPSHAKNVKHYQDGLPLFARYQVEHFLDGMFNPTVQLPSGGYIVIGITEALVAVDVNSGRATREGSIEQTALKTNLEAADEVARQLRLRDLAGLIVIDFIDMDERRNVAAVEKRMKERLKSDRARIQVGRISGFGLMEMSRQRMRPGMLEATTQPCPHCHGTGLIRSDDSLGLSIIRALEEEGVRRRSREVVVKAPVGIANFLINEKRGHIAQIEARHGLAIRIESDPKLVAPDYSIDKFKTSTRAIDAPAAVKSGDAQLMEEIDVAESTTEVAKQSAEAVDASEDGTQKKKRRRRRRRRGGQNTDATAAAEDIGSEEQSDAQGGGLEAPSEPEMAKGPKRGRSRRKPKSEETLVEAEPASDVSVVEADQAEEAVSAEAPSTEKAKPKPKRTRSRKKSEEIVDVSPEADAAVTVAEDEAGEAKPAKKRTRTRKPKAVIADPAPAVAADLVVEEAVEAAPETKSPNPAPPSTEAIDDEPSKPKRRGWWSLGR